MTTPLPELILYTRPGCHLCEDARALAQSLLEDRAARGRPTAAIRERDITTNAEWERAYSERIPVLELGGRRLELSISAAKLRTFLDESLDGRLA